jgi:hypothetical protein
MPKVRGQFVAVRSRMIKTRNGETQSFQAAYIPSSDEHGFPAVINVDLGVFGMLQNLNVGSDIELTYVETPPYGDKFAVKVDELVAAAK